MGRQEYAVYVKGRTNKKSSTWKNNQKGYELITETNKQIKKLGI